MEYSFHFEKKINRILYFYREEDSNIQELKAFFGTIENVDVKFLKKLPEDLLSITLPNSTVIVFDDHENYFSNDKQYAELLFSLASVHVHHRGLICFFVVQTIGILKKQHKLNNSFSQSTHVIFFRNAHEGKALKRYMNNFSLKLKGGVTVFDVFERFIQKKKFSYLLLCVSPRCDYNTAFSNILMSSDGPMLSFHESDNSDVE